MLPLFLAFFAVMCMMILYNYGTASIRYIKFVSIMRKLPQVPGQRFFLGNLDLFMFNRENCTSNYLSVTQTIMENGGFGVAWLSWYPIIIVSSWKYTSKTVGNKLFLNRGYPTKWFMRGLQSLLSLNDGEWRSRRALVSPSFSHSVIRRFTPTMFAHFQHMIAELGLHRGKLIEPLAILENNFLSLILETSICMSDRMSPEDWSELKESLTKSMEASLMIYPQSVGHFLGILRDWIVGKESAREKLIKHATRIIDTRLKDLSSTEKISEDCILMEKRNQAFLDSLLGAFLNESSSKKYGIDREALVSELVLIMVASFETVINSSMWFLHNVSQAPDIQEKIFHELLDFDLSNKDVTAQQLNELKFLDQCLKENLRIHPPFAFVARLTNHEIELNGYTIPTDTFVTTCIYSIHHDEKVFPDPEKFNPDRFQPDNFEKIPHGAYIPFGDGPRRCIGEQLAIIETKLFIIHIIKRFRIIPDPENDGTVKLNMATKPKKPLKFHFISRGEVE